MCRYTHKGQRLQVMKLITLHFQKKCVQGKACNWECLYTQFTKIVIFHKKYRVSLKVIGINALLNHLSRHFLKRKDFGNSNNFSQKIAFRRYPFYSISSLNFEFRYRWERENIFNWISHFKNHQVTQSELFRNYKLKSLTCGLSNDRQLRGAVWRGRNVPTCMVFTQNMVYL